MSQIRKDILTDRWVITEDGEGVAPDELSFQEIRTWHGLLPVLRGQRGGNAGRSFLHPRSHIFAQRAGVVSESGAE